ncbi:respiratory burst oxidase homolog protein A-like isoform X1 [Rosa rugosa]|uniref:respiratory burst oxidase homolog protein A-like isoform X1 n=1 Tax=Rosa rugosa TaxID=74645 RepID=UPI002B413C2E|nr:respiratory burst oxidase homolog protein A-like isoform X1 [Rosa rugosa]
MEAQPSSLSPSSSSSCSTNDNIMPLSFSPVWTESDKTEPLQAVNQEKASTPRSDTELLRFMDLTANGGMRWEDVEDRFDRLAITHCQIDPVIKWSDFGLCIGMKQSQEFANQLLRALRKSKDCNFCIRKAELHSYWCRMTDPCFNSRMQIFFDLCDRNMEGRMTEIDIKQTIILSATTNKLFLTPEEAEDYAALVMELLDTEKRGYIELPQFETLFKVSLSKASFSNNHLSIRHDPYHNFDRVQEPNSRIEILFRSYWRRAWIVLLWLTICSALFTWKFLQYRHRAAFQVMGYCLSSAKGAAETLKFNMALILLPVCRNTITWLRRNRSVNSIIPFNDTINFHKLIAGGIVVGVILHGGCHLACDLPRISDSDHVIFRQTIAAQFGYHQPSYFEILSTKEVASGIGTVILMAIAFSLATTWPRRGSPSLPKSVRNVTGYNTFWYSHHLFIPVYALLIFHSIFLFLTNNVNEKTTWMYIAIPVLLYTGERVFRAMRSGFYEVEMLKASIHPGKVVSLKLHKPKGFKYLSGMYIFIQCPQISPFEWHPFSLTSGPEDDYLSVHIRTSGDWSYQIYSLFQEATLSGLNSYPKVHIDGPYGAASQDHVKYDTIVLIGLGIGATPFIGILKDIVNGAQNSSHCDHHSGCRECSSRKSPLKAYLFWVTREQSSFEWFRDIMKEISNSSEKQSVVEMHNFLTSVYQEGDARSVLISAIQALHYAKNGIDFVSRTPVRTHFARPNWSSIFSKLACKHRRARIGVFYCGASTLANELEGMCTKFSTKTSTRFVFHKENY